MEHPSSGNGIEAVVSKNPIDGTVTVKGHISGLGAIQQKIHWNASSPSTRGIGFAGAGLPYPNKDIAYENSPNKGIVDSPNGSFTIQLTGLPNGYYSGLGSIYIPPTVEFIAVANEKVFKTTLLINDVATPYRWVSGAPASLKPDIDTEDSTGRALYYSGREQIPLFKNQETLFRATGYPSNATVTGWPETNDASPWKNVPAPI